MRRRWSRASFLLRMVGGRWRIVCVFEDFLGPRDSARFIYPADPAMLESCLHPPSWNSRIAHKSDWNPRPRFRSVFRFVLLVFLCCDTWKRRECIVMGWNELCRSFRSFFCFRNTSFIFISWLYFSFLSFFFLLSTRKKGVGWERNIQLYCFS